MRHVRRALFFFHLAGAHLSTYDLWRWINARSLRPRAIFDSPRAVFFAPLRAKRDGLTTGKSGTKKSLWQLANTSAIIDSAGSPQVNPLPEGVQVSDRAANAVTSRWRNRKKTRPGSGSGKCAFVFPFSYFFGRGLITWSEVKLIVRKWLICAKGLFVSPTGPYRRIKTTGLSRDSERG